MAYPLYMRHNFPVAEAFAAAGYDPEVVAQVAPGVDPAHLLVREARPWFERIYLRTSRALALPHVIYLHSRLYTRPRAEVARLLLHEFIHVSQWRRKGIPRFIAGFLGDYLVGRLRRRGHRAAYSSIRLEVEARMAVARVAGPKS